MDFNIEVGKVAGLAPPFDGRPARFEELPPRDWIDELAIPDTKPNDVCEWEPPPFPKRLRSEGARRVKKVYDAIARFGYDSGNTFYMECFVWLVSTTNISDIPLSNQEDNEVFQFMCSEWVRTVVYQSGDNIRSYNEPRTESPLGPNDCVMKALSAAAIAFENNPLAKIL